MILKTAGKAFHAAKPESMRNWECIHGTETMLAGFPHLYYYGNPKVAEAFLKECMKYHSRRESDRVDIYIPYNCPGSRFILDLIFGDPRWLYHPVCLIGKLISSFEKGIRKVFPKTEKR